MFAVLMLVMSIAFLTGLIIQFVILTPGVNFIVPLVLFVLDVWAVIALVKVLKILIPGKVNKEKISNKEFPIEFETLYKRIYANKKGRLEKLRGVVRNISILYLICFSFTIFGFPVGEMLIIFLGMNVHIGSNILFFLVLFSIPIDIVLFIMYKNEMKKYKDVYKEDVISNLVSLLNNNLTYTYGKNSGLGLVREYEKSGFDKFNFDKFITDDYIEGKIDRNLNIRMTDVIIKSVFENSRRRYEEELFRGIFAVVDSGLYISDKSIAIYRSIYSNKSEKKIEMDSSEFNSLFSVFSEDKMYAMEILTSDIMSLLIKYKKTYDLDFEIIINGTKIYFRFYINDMFEPKIFKNSLDKNVLFTYYSVIEFIIEVTSKMNKAVLETDIL